MIYEKATLIYFKGRLESHKADQVGRDLERLSGLTSSGKGSLSEIT